MTEPNEELAQALTAVHSATAARISAPNQDDRSNLPKLNFDRLSVERRVLCFITDDVSEEQLGPRNTLAAIGYDLIRDVNTTNPPAPNARLELEGKTPEDLFREVQEHLERLVGAGLVERNGLVYRVTDAGRQEMAS